MKSFLILVALSFAISAQASDDCRLYLIMSSMDGGPQLTNKIVKEVFIEKGYEVIRIERITKDMLKTGSVNELVIFSEAHASFGARTDITITNISLDIDSGAIAIEEQMELKLTKPDSIFSSATKRLIKAVSDTIPACSNL